MARQVDVDSGRETLTIEDLKASAGKGPRLEPSDIANTYYSDEEFLAALAARRGRCRQPSACVGASGARARQSDGVLARPAQADSRPAGRARPLEAGRVDGARGMLD